MIFKSFLRKNFLGRNFFLPKNIKVCRSLLTLMTSGDLGCTLIPMVIILKIISNLLAIDTAQNNNSSATLTKKNPKNGGNSPNSTGVPLTSYKFGRFVLFSYYLALWSLEKTREMRRLRASQLGRIYRTFW